MYKVIGLALSLFILTVSFTQFNIDRLHLHSNNIVYDTITMPDTAIATIDSMRLIDSIKLTGKVVNGIASFYSANLDGTKTATGEVFRNSKFTGASNNLKLNTWVKVTNISNGKTVVVRINDRMHPAMKKKGRVIDLSRAAAQKLDFMKKGLTKVKLEVIDPPNK